MTSYRQVRSISHLSPSFVNVRVKKAKRFTAVHRFEIMVDRFIGSVSEASSSRETIQRAKWIKRTNDILSGIINIIFTLFSCVMQGKAKIASTYAQKLNPTRLQIKLIDIVSIFQSIVHERKLSLEASRQYRVTFFLFFHLYPRENSLSCSWSIKCRVSLSS